MPVIPNPNIIRNIMFYMGLGKVLLITWVICRIFVFLAVPVILFLAVKYAYLIPSNPNYRHNYDRGEPTPQVQQGPQTE